MEFNSVIALNTVIIIGSVASRISNLNTGFLEIQNSDSKIFLLLNSRSDTPSIDKLFSCYSH